MKTRPSRAIWPALHAFFEALGIVGLAVASLVAVFPSTKTFTEGTGRWFYAVAPLWALLQGYVKSAPLRSYSAKLRDRDVHVGFRVADALAINGALVVPTNTTFDMDIDGRMLDARSVQGALLRDRYKRRVEHLDHDISAALRGVPHVVLPEGSKPGKLLKYPIGTVAHVKHDNRHYYFLAISDINGDGRAAGSAASVQDSLPILWNDIRRRGERSDIVVPLLGTGHARTNLDRRSVAQMIVRSFVAATAESTFSERLTLSIHPTDAESSVLDLENLRNFVYAACEHSDLSGAGPVRNGTPA